MHHPHKDLDRFNFKLKLQNFTFNFYNFHTKITDREKSGIRAPTADLFHLVLSLKKSREACFIFGTVGYEEAPSDFIFKELKCNCKGKVISYCLHTIKSSLTLSICPDFFT